ncbi:hypothetical protein BU16DRAFT_561309 [Lophium mytilinum]|uniref:SAM domain-containing protein n=1 Tax=Lophium mytilinum TaxID=390894 RepID=A0A6A6QWL7_9PEZI|nr:hypothetical protein BU16DRAFT_561309 [Lophium mytilinum]
MADLTATLRRLGLAEYHDTFMRNGVADWDTVGMLTEEDLKELGVKLGHRRILQRAATDTHSHEASRKPSEEEDTNSNTCSEYPTKSTRPIQASDHSCRLSQAMDNYFGLILSKDTSERRKFDNFLSLAPHPTLISTFHLREILLKYTKDYVLSEVLIDGHLSDGMIDILRETNVFTDAYDFPRATSRSFSVGYVQGQLDAVLAAISPDPTRLEEDLEDATMSMLEDFDSPSAEDTED